MGCVRGKTRDGAGLVPPPLAEAEMGQCSRILYLCAGRSGTHIPLSQVIRCLSRKGNSKGGLLSACSKKQSQNLK